jgi:hypothetical protein
MKWLGAKALLAPTKLKRMTRTVLKEIVDTLAVFLLPYW